MCKFHIQPEWQGKFQSADLSSAGDSLALAPDPKEKYFSNRNIEAFSVPKLGSHVVMKRQTKFRCSALLRGFIPPFRVPCLLNQERENIGTLKENGFLVPEIIAWGEKKSLGLEKANVLFLQYPEGKILPDYLAEELDLELRRHKIQIVENALFALHSKGFSWKDCKAANFLLLPDDKVCLMNVAGIQRRKVFSVGETQQEYEIFYSSLVD